MNISNEFADYTYKENASVVEMIQEIKELNASEETKKFLIGYARRPDLRLKRQSEEYGPWTRIYSLVSYVDKNIVYNACFTFMTYRRFYFLTRLFSKLSYIWSFILSMTIFWRRDTKVGHIRFTIDKRTDIDVFHWTVLSGKTPDIYVPSKK